MSIEKNFEKEKIKKLKKIIIICKILFGRLLPLIEENEYQAWCSELVSEYQKSSLQHLTIVRNSFFFPFRTEKSRFMCLSFIDFVFTLNVIFELRYCKSWRSIFVGESLSYYHII